jgi:tryptophanase
MTGYAHVVPTHQGRAAEHLLFSLRCQAGRGGAVEQPLRHHPRQPRSSSGARAVNLPIPESSDPANRHPFKGNMDTAALESLHARACRPREHPPRHDSRSRTTPAAGSPSRLANIRAVSRDLPTSTVVPLLPRRLPLRRERLVHPKVQRAGPAGPARPRDCPRDVLSLADGSTGQQPRRTASSTSGASSLMQATPPWVPASLRSLLILTEGFPTYGGLAARDLEAWRSGFDRGRRRGLPRLPRRGDVRVPRRAAAGPPGCRTIAPSGRPRHVHRRRALRCPTSRRSQFPGPGPGLRACTACRAASAACEIGSGHGRPPHGSFQPEHELVRLAIPRRVYTQSPYRLRRSSACAELFQARASAARPADRRAAPEVLRHFTARFAPL